MLIDLQVAKIQESHLVFSQFYISIYVATIK